MKQIRILIADDHKVVRLGLKALFGTEPDMAVVGEAEDGAAAVKVAGKVLPDVVIMDLMMPRTDGIEATKLILAEHPDIRVLILTSLSSSDGIAAALDAGAQGALLKSADDATVLEAVRRVAAGESYVQSEIRNMLTDDPPIPKLTPRQLDVLRSMTRGLTNKDIATQLGLCETRVIQHVNALLTKIGAANRTEAVAIALRKHLLKI